MTGECMRILGETSGGPGPLPVEEKVDHMGDATTTQACCKESAGGCKAALCSGLHVMGVARGFLNKGLEDFKGAEWTRQPSPGVNHALFIAGHLAVSDAFFLQTIGGSTRAVPEGWNELFGMGAEPKADASAYPTAEKALRAMEQARKDLVAHFRSLDDAALAAAVHEPLNNVADCVAGLTSFIAMHDGIHTGQLLSVRKAMQKPYLYG